MKHGIILVTIWICCLAHAGWAQDQTITIPGPPQLLSNNAAGLINISDASLNLDNAEELITLTLGNRALRRPNSYCIIHILKWKDNQTAVETQRWYLYYNGRWSKKEFEELRIFGSSNVSLLNIHLKARGGPSPTAIQLVPSASLTSVNGRSLINMGTFLLESDYSKIAYKVNVPLKAASLAAEALTPLLLQKTGEEEPVTSHSKKRRKDIERIASWHWRSNIIGFAVGEKYANRQPVAGQFCLKFFVREKLAKSRLKSYEKIPPKLSFDSLEEEVLTDIEPFPGTPVAQSGLQFRPLRPGSSIGHFLGTSGTIGLIVRLINDNRPLLLSCSHVLARAGMAQSGDPVEQPADFDRAPGINRVGRLVAFSRIVPGSLNTVDAAIAELDNNQIADPAILDLGRPRGVQRMSPAALARMAGIPLLRSGDATGRQSGSLLGVHATFPIRIPVLGDRIAVFRDLAVYRTVCGPGDIGAAVLDGRTGGILGLHIAGTGGFGFFTPIETVFNELGIELF